MTEQQQHSISHRDVLRERVFKEVTELMKSLGWALIQHNWYRGNRKHLKPPRSSRKGIGNVT